MKGRETIEIAHPAGEEIQWDWAERRMKWTPHFINGYLDHLAEGSDGRPGWLQPWFRLWRYVRSPAPRAFAYFVAVTETLIALSLVIGIARNLTYFSATFSSLMIWSTAEGFAGPYTVAAPIWT